MVDQTRKEHEAPTAEPEGQDLTDSQDGGVLKVIKHEGTSDEKPKKGNKVFVHYTGTLVDGTVFDTSRNRDKFSFTLGKREVIRSWDIGVASMKKGEICVLTCKPEYAYGEQGSPPKIPKNATLIFEIELFDWEGEDLTPGKDKGVIREMIKEGEDYTTPNEGAQVEVKFLGKYEDKVFDERKVNYVVGEADEELELIPAIDIAVKKMKSREQCRVFVKPKYGFGSEGCEKHGIPANANLVYELELLSFEKAKEAWEMTDEEKIEQSEIVKTKGTEHFKAERYKQAIVQYKKIDDYLAYHDAKEDGSDEDKELLKKWNSLKVAGLLNLALCQIKEKSYADAVQNCDKVLEVEPKNEKALYRRGEAFFSQVQYEDAKKSYAQTLEVNPNNKMARSRFETCSKKIKEKAQQEKRKYAGMFDKFAREDKEEEIRYKVEQKKERAKQKAASKPNGTGEGDESAQPVKSD